MSALAQPPVTQPATPAPNPIYTPRPGYKPPPVAPAATPGTLALDGLAAGVRDATLAAIDAAQAFSWVVADDHLRHALSIDSTFGLARNIGGNIYNVSPGVANHARATADGARRPIPEQTVALAYRAYSPQAGQLFGAARLMLPNDRRIAFEHVNQGFAGQVRLDSLRALATRYPDFAAPLMWRAFWPTQNILALQPQAAAEALEDARAAVRVGPNLAGSHIILAHVLHRMGTLDEAAQHLSAGLRLDPQNGYGYELQAEIFMRDARTDRQVERARTALDSARVYTLDLNRRYILMSTSALLLMHEGKIDEMIAMDTTTIRTAQRSSWLAYASEHWGRLAVQVGAAGRTAAANAYLDEMRRIVTTPTVASLTNEVLAYGVTKQAAEARRALTAYAGVLGASPNANQTNFLASFTALTLLAEGKNGEAVAACTNVPTNSQFGWCDYVRIETLVAAGRTAEADAMRAAYVARKNIDNRSIQTAILRYRSLRR
jgi:tetratricopeptide (TPR) repeat protein